MRRFFKKVLWLLLLLLLLGGAGLFYRMRIASDVEEGRIRAVETAVERAAAQCYAVEGIYPERLSYLEEHYGLLLNHRRYIISYECYAANERPQIMVLKR